MGSHDAEWRFVFLAIFDRAILRRSLGYGPIQDVPMGGPVLQRPSAADVATQKP